jgi:S-adenosylmethionine hydrolase
VGSDGYLEIAVREGNAATHLGLGVGSVVEVQGFKGA